MTRENLYRPWVYFEAGGAALRGARVIPLLVGLTPGELPSPLSLYQARTTSQDDLWRMVEEIRVAVGADLPPVEPGRFQEAWQAFHDEVPDDPVPYTRWDSVLRAEQLLDTGITHAWKQRKDATALMLQDIAGAGQSITMIARVYLSELVKDEAFPSVLTRWAQRGGPAERAVTLIQSDPEDTGLMAEQYATENQRARWRDVGGYADHVRGQGAFTADIVEGALRAGLALRTSGPGAVRLTQGRVSGSLLPWCFLEIDRRVVYVSFYRRQGTSTYGTNAPTLRAERPEKGDARFFDQLVIEAAALAEGAGTDRCRSRFGWQSRRRSSRSGSSRRRWRRRGRSRWCSSPATASSTRGGWRSRWRCGRSQG
jgi:hypothetical protein